MDKSKSDVEQLNLLKQFFCLCVYIVFGCNNQDSYLYEIGSVLFRKNSGTKELNIYIYISYIRVQIIAASAEVTPNCRLVKEPPKCPKHSDLGIAVFCPDEHLLAK